MMNFARFWPKTTLSLGIGLSLSFQDASAAPPVDFSREIQPILAKHCYDCHGPQKQKSGYRLDLKETALKGGDSGKPAIVPGKSAESHLLELVSSTNPEERMPRKGDPLTENEIKQLRSWIDQGARWPESADKKTNAVHWAFQPP